MFEARRCEGGMEPAHRQVIIGSRSSEMDRPPCNNSAWHGSHRAVTGGPEMAQQNGNQFLDRVACAEDRRFLKRCAGQEGLNRLDKPGLTSMVEVVGDGFRTCRCFQESSAMIFTLNEAQHGSKAGCALFRMREVRRGHLASVIGDGQCRVRRSKVDAKIHGGYP